MGNFGIIVSQGNWQLESEGAQAPVIAGDPKRRETTMDRVLAYLSFYVLVFAAFCAFLPAQTGAAFAYVQELNPIAASKPQLLKRDDWLLRGTIAGVEGWTIRESAQ